jgi:hypothetical protein
MEEVGHAARYRRESLLSSRVLLQNHETQRGAATRRCVRVRATCQRMPGNDMNEMPIMRDKPDIMKGFGELMADRGHHELDHCTTTT